MAQLTEDSFAFGGPLLTIEEAEKLIGARLTPVAETERLSLGHAMGRVLADDLISPLDLPSFDNSAVDGYAVAHASLMGAGKTRLAVTTRIFAGHSAGEPLKAGTAARIFTGAPMPEGADTVFMQEDVRTEGDEVIVPTGLKKGANRRLKGEDVQQGRAVLLQGCRLQPQHLAMAAAVGIAKVDVRRRLRIAVFSTGDEIIEPGTPLLGSAVFDANRTLLCAMASRLGAEVTDLGILADAKETLASSLKAAARHHDLVVTSGGVSTGDADYVRMSVESAGSLVFWRIAIKPGRPVAMGVLPGDEAGQGSAFVGLPGNPVAAFVTFARIVRPLMLRLSGANPERLTAFPVRVAFGYKKKAGRREYVRVTLRRAADGKLEAVKFPQDGAGVISSITATDGLVELPEATMSIEPGAEAGFISYADFIG